MTCTVHWWCHEHDLQVPSGTQNLALPRQCNNRMFSLRASDRRLVSLLRFEGSVVCQMDMPPWPHGHCCRL